LLAEISLFLLGHLAWGYLLGKGSAKLLRVNINLPLIFALSVLPDIDRFIPGLAHHGPTHSLLAIALFFIPVFIIYQARSVPYFVALVQHVIADLPSLGGIMILWPLTTDSFTAVSEFGRTIFVYYSNYMIFETSLEWVGFLLSVILLLKQGDIARLLKPRLSNLVLLFPAGGLLLSFFFGTPVLVILPSLVFLLVFLLSAFSFIQHHEWRST
jgi:hypothetical protein